MTENKTIDILDIVLVLVQKWKKVITIMGVFTLLGLAVALLWPKKFKTDLTYIINSGNSINFSSGGLLSGLANLSASGNNVSSDQTLVLLRSNQIKDKMIEEFNLFEVYSSDVLENVREKLDNNIMIEEMREGGIGFNAIIAVSFSVIDESPERSFEMTKYLYSLLDSVALSINKKNIESSYLMLQNRLDQNMLEMEQAEDSLILFQEANGILQVEEQARAMVENIAEIKSAMVEKEIEMALFKQTLGVESSRYKTAQVAYEELTSLYDGYLNKESSLESQGDIFKSVSEMPPLFAEYYRLFREVEIQQEIYKVLYPQYEQQKLNFNEINSGLSLIDEPTLPTYKFYPKRAFIVIAFFLLGFIVLLLRLWYEHWVAHIRETQPELYDKLLTLPFVKG